MRPAPTQATSADPAAADSALLPPQHDVAADRLLDAAEKLIAERGLTVPDRAIVAESGHRNNSAISYHFGDRQGLLDAVWQRRTLRVEQRRTEYLVSRGLSLDELDLRTALACYVTSLTDEMASLSPSYWARFLEQVMQDEPLNFLVWVDADIDRFPDRVLLSSLVSLFERLRQLTPSGVQPTSGDRVALTVRFVIATLAAWERDAEAGHSSWRSLSDLSSELVGLTLALLNAEFQDLDNLPTPR